MTDRRREDGDPSESADLRLVPAAAAAWVGAAVTVGRPSWIAPGAGVAAAVLVTALALALLPALRRRRVPVARALPAAALAALVLVGALTAGVVLRHERTSGPLAEAVAGGWTATVRGAVSDDPVLRR